MKKTINPHTEQVIKEYEHTSSSSLERILSDGKKAQASWAQSNLSERTRLAQELGDELLRQKELLARTCTDEMGKPIKEAIQEVEKCARACLFYAEHGEQFLADIHFKTEMRESFVSCRPLGTVLCVMPWNFPYWQAIRVAVPALIAGNAIILKHATNTTGSAELLTNIIQGVFPKHLFQQIVADHTIVANMIADPRIHAVSLTGSEEAGSKVAASAGQHLKKSVLELGGSDPYIIFPDADIESAAKICVNARLLNNGQSCIAAKRFIVCKPVYNQFIEAFLEFWHTKPIGDPQDEHNEVGPLARKDLVQAIQKQLHSAVLQGAKAHESKQSMPDHGFYMKPTVLTDVSPGMTSFHEETFGPLASISSATSEEHAINLANLSKYGLGAAIFTKDLDRGRQLAKMHVDAGFVAVNTNVRSDPRLPFGGIKVSGFGRELGEAGIKEFVNLKTITIQ